MVRLSTGQRVKTEVNGDWNIGRVMAVDCSLVRMKFDIKGKQQFDWIYRGSTRLWPLFEALVCTRAL